MKKITSTICIVALIFLLVSCSNNKARSTARQPTDTGTVINTTENTLDSSNNTNNTIITSRNLGATATSQGTASKIHTDSTSSLDVPQIYKDYIKQLDPNTEDDVCFFAIEDMNLDGENEIIIGTGTSGDAPYDNYVSHLYILSNKSGVIKQLGDDLSSGGYMIYQVKLIHMQDNPKEYLYCGLTNSVNLTGFKIIGLADNKPYEFCYSASATGAGEDKLMDFNNDGQFDGYTQNRWSYDVLYYSLFRTYIFKNNTFKLDKTAVDLPDYPASVKDVILQYLSLNVIDAQESAEVNKRLAELYCDENANHSDFSPNGIFTALFNTLMESPDGIDFNINEQTDIANADISYKDENNSLHKYHFELKKTDNKWTITVLTKTVIPSSSEVMNDLNPFFSNDILKLNYKGTFSFNDITENISGLINSNKLLEDNAIVCQDIDIKDSIEEGALGWHHYLEVKGNERVYHSYNNQIETGFYESFIWEKNIGLISYESGYGAERDSIVLTAE